MGGVRGQLKTGVAALGANFARADLRRAQLAFGSGYAAEWAFTVAIGVVAFRDGGAAAVGLVALLRMLPVAVAAPLATAFAERFRRDQVLVSVSVLRAAALAAVAVLVATGAPAAAVYALAVMASIPFAAFRPAHSALLPALCSTPHDLTSANAARGLLDAASTLLGPLLAAALLAASGPESVFAAAAALSLWSALLVALVDYEPVPRDTAPERMRLVAQTVEGLKTIAAEREVGVLLAATAAQTATRGALNVLTVVIAIDLLESGEPGVGVLTGAIGVGAVAGSLGASLLVDSRRLAACTGVGIAMWGAPIVVIGLLPSEPVAVAMLAFVGAGNSLVDLGLFTLFPRLLPDEVLARVFGALESLAALAVGLGALVTPALIAVLGIEGALMAIGLVAPATIVVCWSRLRAIDERLGDQAEVIDALRRSELLRPLPISTVEQLARHARSAVVAAGEPVFEQGDRGEDFYVIVDGEVEVSCDGRLLRYMGPGESFGEIALLRDVPRTATVRARTGVDLLAVERRRFVPIVSGYRPSVQEAETVIDARLRNEPDVTLAG